MSPFPFHLIRCPLASSAALVLLAACQGEMESGDDDDSAWGQVPLAQASCAPDGDGEFTSAEVAVDPLAEVMAVYLANAPGTTVQRPDPTGVADEGGAVTVDLAFPQVEGETPQTLTALPLEGSWYGEEFPEGEFSSVLDASEGILGVFSQEFEGDGGGAYLLGIASMEEGETWLRYDPPVPLFQLPLAEGDAWEVEADAVGVASGQTWPQDLGEDGVVSLVHHYAFTAASWERVQLPIGELPALRLQLKLRTLAYNSLAGLFASESQRVDFYVAECAGVVARVRSLPDETDGDFTEATEILRLGFFGEVWP